MENVKEKIKKLLSLATSPNENEAKAALLKARELMAKHKISEQEFEDTKPELKSIEGGVSWTTDSGEIWIVDVCTLIANNYCCSVSWNTPKGSRTHKLRIVGLNDDADICKSLIEYAVGFVRGQIKILQRKNKIYDGKTIANSYATGFVMGLEMAFEEQNEQEWGLVLVKPEEVRKYEESLSERSVKTRRTELDPLFMLIGQHDGIEFNKTKAIEQAV